MHDHRSSAWNSSLNTPSPPRVAVVGGGIGGLACARELRLRGCDPVVFEAEDRLGGRCSSRSTRVGLFDDGAQCISGASRLAIHVAQPPGELAALHPWTVAATPTEEERNSKAWKQDEDEADVTRTLKLTGSVGVPSMAALADALARPLHIRLNTPIVQARRRAASWALSSAVGEIEEDFQALVLAMPAPLAVPLARESSELTAALRAVRYRSRWVLLLGTERPVPLPGYREFQGSPIERVAAMHSKPGRLAIGPQRWFVEAGGRWSSQHEDVDAETVADLLLENFRAHAGRPVTPNYLRAQQWRHAFVETPAAPPRRSECLWDDSVRLGVCGDSVVASQVDRVHSSGVAMARVVAEGLSRHSGLHSFSASKRDLGQLLEAHL
ncbi:MAG: FAD-dependent oxidoreductase [Betaproteobacteria bacterium]|nr:FAD-dependent oxidoreductase [Betaproteobacteria bacterium]